LRQLFGRGFKLECLGQKTGGGDQLADQRRLSGLIDDSTRFAEANGF
jgi:hypothetical protein